MIPAIINGIIGGAIAGFVILELIFRQDNGVVVGIVFGILLSVGKFLGKK